MVAGGRGAASGTWRARLLVVVCVALVAWSACTAAAVGAAAEGEGEAWLPCDAGTAEFLPLPELLCAPRYAVHVRIAEDEVPSGVRAEERGTGGVAALLQGLEMAPGLAAGQEVEMVHDGMRFRCSVPAYPAVLRSVHPRQELRLRGPGEGLLHHPLDRDEMLLVDDLLAPMQNNCYFQTMEEGQDSFLYEFCFGVSVRRGRMHRTGTKEEDGNTVTYVADDTDAVFERADVGVDWTDVRELGRRPRGLPQWGVMEADEGAYLTSGHSTFFYQWYGDAFRLEVHCSDRLAFLHVDEVRSGEFVGAFGSPLACRHPFIVRADSFYADIECALVAAEGGEVAADVEGQEGLSEMDGLWTIFEAANNPSHAYWGTVTFTTREDHSWEAGRPLLVSCKERQLRLQGTAPCAGPKLVDIDWQLEQVSYSGIGAAEDGHVCAVWSTNAVEDGPGLASLRVLNNDTLEGFWWSPQYGHGVEMWYRIEDDDGGAQHESPVLEGQFSVLGIRDSNEGPRLAYSMLAAIKYSPVHDTYSVIWTGPGERLLGRGILSGKSLCVVFREAPQANDGVVTFRKEGNTARGLWMLFYNKVLQKEDIVRVL